MLKVIWLGILILVYLVSRSLQHDSASEDDGIQQRYNNLKLVNSKESLDNKLEYLIRQARSENDGGHPDHSNGPKRVKLTYKKRTKINKKPPLGSETNNENSNHHENKMEHNLDDSINPDYAKLLPLLVKYLTEHGSEKHSLRDNISNKKDVITKLWNSPNKTEDENKDLGKYSLHHHDWTKLELDSNKVKENKPEEKPILRNSVIGTIYFPNTNENGAHNSYLDSKKVTTKEYQVDVPSGNDFSNTYNQGGIDPTYHWNSNPLGANNKGKEVQNTAVSKDLDPSQIDILIKKMCVNSKKNFLEFWNSAAGYLGLNHENLSDKQKYDLFLTVLKKVNDNKQQDHVETVPLKTKYGVSVSKKNMPQEVIPTENTKNYWYDYSEPEDIQIPKQNLNEEVPFSGPNQKVVNGLGSDEILVLNTYKPDKHKGAPIKDPLVNDNFGQNWNNEKVSLDTNKSSETNPVLSPKFLKPSGILLNYFNSELGPTENTVVSTDQPKLSNGEESTSKADYPFENVKSAETKTDVFPYSESPQVAISDSNYESGLLKLNENEGLESLISLTPDLEKNVKQDISNEMNKKMKENTDQEKQKITFSHTVHVDSGPITEKPSELSILTSPKGRNNHSEKQVFNDLLDYLNATIAKEDAKPADNLYIKLDTKQKPAENIPNEASGSKNKPLNLIQINKILALSKVNKDKSLNDLDESQSSQEQNSKRLALLLHYLKTLPKDKLAKIILSLKYNIVQKNNKHNSNWPEDQKYLDSLYKSTPESDDNDIDKLKILVQYLEDQSKDKVTSALLDTKGNEKLHPKLLLKYNLALKNKEHTDDYQYLPHISLDDITSKSKEYDIDHNGHRPKLHLKWNIKPNILTKVLLEIISRFKQYGVSEEALRNIINDLKQALSENDSKTDCEAQELNKKINSVKNAFDNLSSLMKSTEV